MAKRAGLRTDFTDALDLDLEVAMPLNNTPWLNLKISQSF